jgi:hypothetical protein
MTKRTDQEPGARVLYTTGCGAMRAAMSLRKLATSSGHMFALSYLAAGRDKDPSMTDAARPHCILRLSARDLRTGGLCRWSDIWEFVSRLLVVYHRQISRFAAFSELGKRRRPPCDPFTRAACCWGPERQGARSARSRRCASRAPSRQPTPAAAGQSDCELPA